MAANDSEGNGASPHRDEEQAVAVHEAQSAVVGPMDIASESAGDDDERDLESELLAKVPNDGSRIGNTSLKRGLKWDDDQYWRVRNRLVDRGELATGRGRGGSVRRTALVVADAGEVVQELGEARDAEVEEAIRESDLYAPLRDTINRDWVQDKRYENWMTEITAQQGKRATGGKWSRPDITVATMSTFPYVPGRHFDVITFEVKPLGAIDVTAVYEALGHLRASTQAYVLLHVDADEEPGDVLGDVTAEAKRHGVGVITFTDASDYDTWDELVEPVRADPDPRRLNDFLAKQMPQEHRERLIKWFK